MVVASNYFGRGKLDGRGNDRQPNLNGYFTIVIIIEQFLGRNWSIKHHKYTSFGQNTFWVSLKKTSSRFEKKLTEKIQFLLIKYITKDALRHLHSGRGVSHIKETLVIIILNLVLRIGGHHDQRLGIGWVSEDISPGKPGLQPCLGPGHGVHSSIMIRPRGRQYNVIDLSINATWSIISIFTIVPALKLLYVT